MRLPPKTAAEVQLRCDDLAPSLAFFTDLGFRIESISPADAPSAASLSGHGLRLRLAPGDGDPGIIRIPSVEPGRTVTAPNGTRVVFVEAEPAVVLPPFRPEFVLTRGGEAGEGRAGMLYRDLIPGRLGGRYIASHITIPEGGPVADWVHYHRVALQLIYVRHGWVRVVYEDQGQPFVMNAGDLVVQPPEIRHRVLESSDGLEVIEVSCPALHETFADHEMILPNRRPTLWNRMARSPRFGEQRFLHRVPPQSSWFTTGDRWEVQSFKLVDAKVFFATACRLRKLPPQDAYPAHNGELFFRFVLSGSATLEFDGKHELVAGDSFVIPPDHPWALSDASPDLELFAVNVDDPTRFMMTPAASPHAG